MAAKKTSASVPASLTSGSIRYQNDHEFWDQVFMARMHHGVDAMDAASQANAAVAARKLARGVQSK